MTMGTWREITPRLSLSMVSVLEDLHFGTMTPVQHQVVPLFLSHKDVYVEAMTGSGKTLAFLVPLIEMLHRQSSQDLSKTSRHKNQIIEGENGFNNTHLGDEVTVCKNNSINSYGHQEHILQWQKHEVAAIVIAPTRDLARQIYNVLVQLLVAFPCLSCILLTGGHSDNDDIHTMHRNGCNILIATPGKLDYLLSNDILAHSGTVSSCGSLGSTVCSVRTLEVLILDEADRLLDLGFEQTINSILTKLPKQRRTGLFSATMNNALSELARAGLRNPVHVTIQMDNGYCSPSKLIHVPNILSSSSINMVDSQDISFGFSRVPKQLHNYFYVCEMDEKLPLLELLLIRLATERKCTRKVIVYMATCACVDFFYKVLCEASNIPSKYSIFSLHGKMPTEKRKKTLERFSVTDQSTTKDFDAYLLLCTDVAARGLDIPEVDWVIQMDPPQDPKTFIHRCGRTARMGKNGNALVLLLPREAEVYVEFMRRRQVPLDSAPEIFWRDTEDNTLMEVSQKSKESPIVETVPTKGVLNSLEMNAFWVPIFRWIIADRARIERSICAFVSYVRAYKEHICQFIFRLHDLNWKCMCRAFVLVYLPKMSELGMILNTRHSLDKADDFLGKRNKMQKKNQEKQRELEELLLWRPFPIALDTISYRARQREAQKLQNNNAKVVLPTLEAQEMTLEPDNHRCTIHKIRGAWSKQKERKQNRQKRRAKREAKRHRLELSINAKTLMKPEIQHHNTDVDTGKNTTKVDKRTKFLGHESDSKNDCEQLEQDARMLKRWRRGLLSETELDGCLMTYAETHI